MKRVWIIVIRVFQVLTKFVSLPIQYSVEAERFIASTNRFLLGWNFWSGAVLVYSLHIFYRLTCQAYFPHLNHDLHFQLQSVVLYLFEFVISALALVSLDTCNRKRNLVVTILNEVLSISRCKLKYYPGDKVTIMGLQGDAGATFASIASLGFLAFPVIGFALPLLVGGDPGTHIAALLVGTNCGGTRLGLILTALGQGTVVGFAAMPCLQMLLVLTATVVEFGGMMWEASAIRHPWIALMLSEKQYEWFRPKRKRALADIAKLQLTKYQLVKCALVVVRKKKRSAEIIRKWKYAAHRVVLFYPSLKLHRQVTILNCVLRDALYEYNPGLILSGMSLIVLGAFFPIQFHPPAMLYVLCVTVAGCMIGVTLTLIPAGALVCMGSAKFIQFWKRYLRLKLNRRQWRSCRKAVICIGPFSHFHEGTALLVMNIILTVLTTLLINV